MNIELVIEEIRNNCKDELVIDKDGAIILNANSLEEMEKIPDHCISLILTDPPYHSTKKKSITGDTIFNTDKDYVEWMREYGKEWKRILKYNGSVFCFCSSEMSPWLQVMFSEEFNVLSEITWTKPNAPGYDGWKQKMKKESLRQWYPHSERVIFLEPAYEGNIFRSYFGNKLREWRKHAGLSMNYLAEVTQSYGKVNHGGAISNWEAGRNIPSEEQYNKLIEALLETGKFDELPLFEDMIRPFKVDGNVEFTDIWTFKNVRQYKGKHPAEKPLDLLKHAIVSTTYENDIVLDCFGGSGATAIASIETKRKCISIEIEKKWSDYAANRIQENSIEQLTL